MRNKMFYASTLLLAGVLGFSVTFMGCQKKQEEPKPAQPVAAVDTVKKAAPVAEVKKADTLSVVGTWKGTLDNKATTLKITTQKGNEFSGSIVINEREVINQKVSGSVNPATKEVQMKDVLHARNQAKYSGKLSADGKKLSGTYTVIVDGTKCSFSLSLK